MSTTPNPSHRVDAPEIERTLPHSEDAEKAILGAMLQLAPEICPLLESLSPAAWYVPAHAAIVETALAMWTAGKPVDAGTLTVALRDTGKLDGVGGAAYLTNLSWEQAASVVLAEHHLGTLRELYALRMGAVQLKGLAEVAHNPRAQVEEIATSLEASAKSMREAATDPAKDGRWSMSGTVMEVIEGIERAHERKGQVMGLSTGLTDLDKLTGGAQNAEMFVIAARPSMGKTALAMNIAEHVAVTLKRPVGIFSLEMSKKQLVQRLICSRARVNLAHVRDGFLTERDFPNLTNAAGLIASAPFYIDDTASLAINDLKAIARRMHKASGGLALVVIDYLQLARSNSRRAQDNRQVEVAEISAGCKALAKELDIPIIVLAQLNRNPEARAGGKPRLSDLRESGSIEQDADVVGMLHRAEYYAEDPAEKERLKGEAELSILKQRNGPVDDVKLTFLKQYTRFEDRAPERTVSRVEELGK